VAVGDRDGKARPDGRASAWRQLGVLAGRQIEAGVARVSAGRDDRVRVEPLNGESGQPSSRRPGADSAITNEANRGRSRRGRRAMTMTPSAVSERSSIGVPSA
jgi:hypothetical protein